jgi:hypothetical protein
VSSSSRSSPTGDQPDRRREFLADNGTALGDRRHDAEAVLGLGSRAIRLFFIGSTGRGPADEGEVDEELRR